jgi:hypothetical protein
MSRAENSGCAMADKDDLDERVTIRVSTKERQRLQEIADRREWKLSATVRRYLRRGLESDDQGAAA